LIDPQFDPFERVFDSLKSEWVTQQVKKYIICQMSAGFGKPFLGRSSQHALTKVCSLSIQQNHVSARCPEKANRQERPATSYLFPEALSAQLLTSRRYECGDTRLIDFRQMKNLKVKPLGVITCSALKGVAPEGQIPAASVETVGLSKTLGY
jgi:hypothetical protein